MKPSQLLTLIAACSIATATADTYTVKNTNPSGVDSFSQAVMDANGHPNIDADTPDLIVFAIPASDPNRDPATGVFTIALPTGLQVVADPVVIDGYTQSGARPNTLATGDDAVLLIELNGGSAMGGFTGVDFAADAVGSTVRGLIVNRFTTGLNLEAGSVKVLGNFIGTDSAGAIALGNGAGIVAASDGGQQIGSPLPADRNLISGNAGSGVTLTNRNSDTNTVQNNYLGVNAAGDAALPNDGSGIVLNGVSGTQGPTVIGGSLATPGSGDGNVISGNASGILFNLGGGGVMGVVTIGGNIIGLGADGTAALGNSGSGIADETDLTSTNGALLITHNIISSNGGNGILYASTNTTVQGNSIGTDLTGTLDRGNAIFGIEMVGDNRDPLDPTATTITIGGTATGEGNVISGNDFGGIDIRNANALIVGNLIGTQADGLSALGNSGGGITVFNVLADPLLQITVGGLAPGSGNTIAYNGAAGVQVGASTVSILRNSIFNNGPGDAGSQFGLGIDLTPGGPGVTPNDAGDADTGPNGYQNFPVLTSVSVATGEANITGSLDSLPSTTYELEFFGNDALDPSGYGEGRYFLGATNVTTDASGHISFATSFPLVPGALRVTATATDPLGNTSEFSTSIGQLQNISTRLRVQTGDNVSIGGFIVLGADDKKVLIRGIGPSLSQSGVPDALGDPTLELHDGTGKLIASNDNWKSDQQNEIEATTIPPTNDLESAIVATLPADGSAYTAILSGKNGSTGIGLVEVYDLDAAANSKPANISTRGFVDTGDNAMIGGFILGGGTADVLVRAIGPSLTSLGVGGALQNPTLDLYDAFGTLIVSNDNWKETQQAEIEATGIPPTNDLESAIVMTLLPAPYTAIVRGQNDTTGVALVEVFELN